MGYYIAKKIPRIFKAWVTCGKIPEAWVTYVFGVILLSRRKFWYNDLTHTVNF